MSVKVISPEVEIVTFLKEIKEILTDPKFDVLRDLDILPKKKKEDPIDPYTTFNTMISLGFDSYDVYTQLLALDITEYMETFIDDKDNNLPPFFAFGKTIKNREICIKVKIRDRKSRKIFCVSFHFARYPLSGKRPYA
ncbi:MAG: hypothetical protein ACYCYI_08400 [Saccharofermentanales bacterium]